MFIVCSNAISFAMQMPLTYYSPGNFAQKIEARENKYIQAYAPCLFIIENGSKSIESADIDAVTVSLDSALTANFFPIIVSHWLLNNWALWMSKKSDPQFVSPSRQELFNTNFNQNYWTMFNVPGTQFIILVPLAYKTTYAKLLKLDPKNDLSNLLPTAQSNFSALTDWLSKNKDKQDAPFKPSDLRAMFYTKTEKNPLTLPIWNFIINGHGLSKSSEKGPRFATLTPEEINAVFTFFDNEILTGIVYLFSCFTGGKNLELLQFIEPARVTAHTFILIAAATSDNIVYGTGTDMFRDFFNLAATVTDRGSGLNQLLKTLEVSLNKEVLAAFPRAGITRGTETIPQVLLPNGLQFQAFNIENDVFVLGNVLIKAAQENKKPIDIKNKKAVLIYPLEIPIPITVSITQYPENQQKQKAEYKESWGRHGMSVLTESAFWERVTEPRKQEIIAELIQKQFISSLPASDFFLFPHFISMVPTSSVLFHEYLNKVVHHFSSITVNAQVLASAGVIRFIRDAFLDPKFPRTKEEKIFLIDELVGLNDLLPLIAAARLLNNDTSKSKLELLLEPLANTAINLKKVWIESHYDQQKKYFTLRFIVNNQAYEFNQDYASKGFWHFQEYPLPQHERYYADNLKGLVTVPTGQKSISEILRLKQTEILKKKQAEKK